jgi:hypothetical protein
MPNSITWQQQPDQSAAPPSGAPATFDQRFQGNQPAITWQQDRGASPDSGFDYKGAESGLLKFAVGDIPTTLEEAARSALPSGTISSFIQRHAIRPEWGKAIINKGRQFRNWDMSSSGTTEDVARTLPALAAIVLSEGGSGLANVPTWENLARRLPWLGYSLGYLGADALGQSGYGGRHISGTAGGTAGAVAEAVMRNTSLGRLAMLANNLYRNPGIRSLFGAATSPQPVAEDDPTSSDNLNKLSSDAQRKLQERWDADRRADEELRRLQQQQGPTPTPAGGQ